MAKRKAKAKKSGKARAAGGNAELRAAWGKVRQAITRAEGAVADLVKANQGLLKAIGKRGSSITQQARGELNANLRKLEKRGSSAGKQLNGLLSRLRSYRR
jgi:hypothetical protein